MMLHLLISAVLASSFTRVTAPCTACLGGNCYTKTKIWEAHHIIGQIDIDRRSHTLYANYNDGQGLFHTTAFNLELGQRHLVPNVTFSSARTVDQITGDMYMTTNNKGIYKFRAVTNATEFYALENNLVWHMQFRHKLYYSGFLRNEFCTYEDGKSTCVASMNGYNVSDFIVDKSDNVYFRSNETIYRLLNNAPEPSVFADAFYTLTTDKHGEAYFIRFDEIYRLDYIDDKLVLVGFLSEGQIHAAVFDGENNIVYHDLYSPESLNRLVAGDKRCRVRVQGMDLVIDVLE